MARPSRRIPPVVAPAPPSGVRRTGRLVQHRKGEGAIQVGFPASWRSDVYHRFLVLSWWQFLLGGSLLYLALNVLFAGLYWLEPGAVDHARPGSFADAFFFSIQTMATIGYGVLTPVGTYANTVVTAETMLSLLLVAFTTGLTFSRFSRPTARVSFSRVATVSPYNGVPTLTVRLSNRRRNQILEADVRMTLLRRENSAEGQQMYRFYDLPLARGHTPLFSLSFTAMHPIDEHSPLQGVTPAKLKEQDAELLVTVTGLDETMSQTIHARTSYLAEDVLFGHRFADMFGYTPEGRVVIDYRRFDEVESCGLPGESVPGETAPGETVPWT